MVAGKYCKRFNRIFSLTRAFSLMCGVDVIEKNYKPGFKTLAVFILINCAVFFSFYTNYVEVVVKGNVHNLLKSTSVIGTGLQVQYIARVGKNQRKRNPSPPQEHRKRCSKWVFILC